MSNKGKADTSDSFYTAARHREAVARKHERIRMYHAILDEWDGRDDLDYDYLADVRRRLHQAEAQLKAMKP